MVNSWNCEYFPAYPTAQSILIYKRCPRFLLYFFYFILIYGRGGFNLQACR